MKSKLLLKSVSALTAGAVMMTLTACSGLSEKVEEVVEEAAVPGSITAYAEEAGAPVVDKKSRGWVSEYGNLRLRNTLGIDVTVVRCCVIRGLAII